MKKIPTLFKKNPENLGLVINEVNPGCEWVFEYGIPTRKYDGTACALIDGVLYKRYDVKKGRSVPEGAIPCQDADPITGHWPHWVKCNRDDPADKYFFEAKSEVYYESKPFATFELCGPKINGNPEKFDSHVLVRHGDIELGISDFSFDSLRDYLEEEDIEGIVFHHILDGRMAKIRKSDFGIKRN